MGFLDKILNSVSKSISSPSDPLHKVTEEDHRNAMIKERMDLCTSIYSAPKPENVRRDGGRDITLLGWQICTVEERDTRHDNRRIGYLNLYKTKNDKFVCQRMTLIDDEEKHYYASTVEDIIDIKNFFGNDGLGVAIILMLDRISKEW